MKDYDHELTVDHDDPRQHRDFCLNVGTLQGVIDHAWTPHQEKMSDRARGYYFGVVCKALMLYVKQQGERMTKEQAHAKFKELFIPPSKFVNRRTGVEETIPGTITRFGTQDGSEHIEKCIQYLAEMGVHVPPPRIYLPTALARRSA